MKKESTPKTEAKKASKPAAVAKASKKEAVKAVKKTSAIAIDKACETALKKLKELNIDENLQGEIQWCLGSYASDGNPSGLYVMAKRALAIFTVELANRTKGVTAKLVSDLERTIGSN